MDPTTPYSRSNGNSTGTPNEVAKQSENVIKAINEWTVMFFFAADGDLSPLVVSQLKAIKEAGFDKTTDVLVYFDSSEPGVPTRLYNVNHQRKGASSCETEVGDGEDPYVRNLSRDDLAPLEGLENNAESLDALTYFLSYCQTKHRAKHYMLFLVGHGMIVGNDAFLPDESPKSAITLPSLREALWGFTASMEPGVETLELLAMHSCSMSALEVAYELKGTAKYMMASEGISYVGSWPYRQILKKTFLTIREAKKAKKYGEEPVYDVDTLMQKLYFLSLFNSGDFMLSGFSSDLSLCNLNPATLKAATRQLGKLVDTLKVGLDDEVAKELIVLAHRESQSYWNENYTDLYDFCKCLKDGCVERRDRDRDRDKDQAEHIKQQLVASLSASLSQSEYPALGETGQQQTLASLSKSLSLPLSAVALKTPDAELLNSLIEACGDMIMALTKDRDDPFSKLVIFSEHFGPKFQYSNGLSVFFPWAEPVDDGNENVMKNYGRYQITTDFRAEAQDDLTDHSWLSFIKKYCRETKRPSRIKEYKKEQPDSASKGNRSELFQNLKFADAFSRAGSLEQKAAGSYEGKAAGSVGGCGCTSIKNYEGFSISPGAELAFSEDSEIRIPERRQSARRQSAAQRRST